MNGVSKKTSRRHPWGLIKRFLIMSIEILGDTGIAKIDEDTNDYKEEIIIADGIGMKS